MTATLSETGSTAAAPNLTVRSLFAREFIPASIGTAAMNWFFGWLTLRGADAIPLMGVPSVFIDLLPATFMSTLMLTLVTTIVVRRRLRRTVSQHRFASSLPRHLFLRAVTLALIATIAVAPAIALALILLSPSRWSWAGFIWFKLGFSLLLTLAGLPIVVRAFLAHDIPRASR